MIGSAAGQGASAQVVPSALPLSGSIDRPSGGTEIDPANLGVAQEHNQQMPLAKVGRFGKSLVLASHTRRHSNMASDSDGDALLGGLTAKQLPQSVKSSRKEVRSFENTLRVGGMRNPESCRGRVLGLSVAGALARAVFQSCMADHSE